MRNFFHNKIFLIFLVFISIQSLEADSLFYSFSKIKKDSIIIYFPVEFDSCSIGFALSGGGARGTAHLGILKRINEYGLPISRLSGTSIGAVIGALILNGYSTEEIMDILQHFEWDRLYNNKADRTDIIVPLKRQNDRYFLTLLLSERGPFIPISLSYGQHLINELARHVFGLTYYYHDNYERMPIPFRIVATDLLTGEKVVLKNGPLTLNLMASMSYPLLFAPVEMNDHLLIDGGIAENIPVEEAKEGVDLVFASDVTAGLRGKNVLKAPWQIADQVTTIMMKYSKSQLEKADFVFQPPVKSFSSSDFEKMQLFKDAGERNFDLALPTIRMMLGKYLKSNILFEKLNVKSLVIHSTEEKISTSLDTIISLNRLIKHLKIFYGMSPDSVVYSINKARLDIYFDSGRIYKTVRIYLDNKLMDVIQPLSKQIILNLFHPVYKNVEDICRLILLKRGYLIRLDSKRFHSKSVDLFFTSIPVNKEISLEEMSGHTRPYIFKRELVSPDSLISHKEALISSINHLYGLDLFRRILVYFTQSRSDDKKALVHIYSEEKSLTNLKIGISANKNLKAEAGFALINNNIAGHNLTFVANGIIGTRRRRISLSFNTNRIGYSYTGFFAGYHSLWESRDVYSNHKNIGKYSYTKDEIAFGVARFIEKLGYTNFSVYFRNEFGPSDIALLNKGRYKSVGIRLESIVDKRNYFPIASAGMYSHTIMESSTILSGNSEIRYNLFQLDLRWYKKIWKYSIINPYFYGGIMENQVPFLTWFTTTGAKRKLGWNIYEAYGRVYGIWGITFYQKIFPYVWGEKYIKLSMDWGNYWHDSETGFNWNEIKPGIGIGFILSTIIGPVELSYELNEKKNSFFWFSLGYDF